MEMAIDFCHGFSLKDLNYPETFSLLFYANVWEIADLKNLLEGRLIDKMGPSNVVNIANAALAGNCGYFQSTCKEYIIRYLKTGKIVRSYASLSEKLCKEIVELLKGD
uniref:Uncharacterized protein n=1 Tax=Panagrolaimus sp. ES5 TaxID=591445 RepID=A0AC34FSM9_9BILA